MKRFIVSYALFLIIIISLSGCSSASNISSSLGGLFGGDGKKTQKKIDTYATAYQIPLNIFTGSNLNSATVGKPLGLVVKIYQLTDYRRFSRASLQDFLSKKSVHAILGDDLIVSRVINLTPHNAYTLSEKIHKGTHYVGIVALFLAPAKNRWRVAFDADKSHTKGITIGLNACALSVTSGKLITKFAGDPSSLSMVNCPTNR